jgi:serine/threonine protein kinase
LADVEVVAHISVHALREERAYHICKALTSTADPNGYHVLQPLDILRLASQHDDDSGLFVCISECAGPNYLSSVIDYGPAWYNLHGLRTGNVVSEQMSLQTFLNFAIGAAECIEILHGQQIVHGEIRGDAFHMDIETGRIRLLNVGAGLRTFEHDLTSTGWSTMSKEPGAIMKLSYMSPEQTGRMPIEPDSRTDIYSLGILFWTMLLQQPAFIGETPMAVIQAVLGQRLPSVSTVRLDIPEVIGRIIQRATAKTASERYHSASGIRHDLVEVLRLLGTGDTAQLLNWEIATKDVSPSFTLPEAIIGRAAEHDAIINVIDNALKLRQIGDIHDKSGINYMSRVSGSHVASLDTAFSKWCELIP